MLKTVYTFSFAYRKVIFFTSDLYKFWTLYFAGETSPSFWNRCACYIQFVLELKTIYSTDMHYVPLTSKYEMGFFILLTLNSILFLINSGLSGIQVPNHVMVLNTPAKKGGNSISLARDMIMIIIIIIIFFSNYLLYIQIQYG